MCTAPIPGLPSPRSRSSASSTFGIMPPEITPCAMASRASAAESRAIRLAGSGNAESTAPTPVIRKRWSASSADASAAATVSALML